MARHQFNEIATLDAYVDKFSSETRCLEEVLEIFIHSMSPPIFYDSGKEHTGFRFLKPTAKHYCVLKAVRAVSGLNASIALMNKGFTQEICVLIRVIVECSSQIEFILAGINGSQLEARQAKVVEDYFADFHRNDSSDFKRPGMRQDKIHKAIAQKQRYELDQIDDGEKFKEIDVSKLMSNVYLTASNYVHCRYPEVMDLYGGAPGRFHMRGMLNTPKDSESVQQIECYLETVAITIRAMVYKFDFVDQIRPHEHLVRWLSVLLRDG